MGSTDDIALLQAFVKENSEAAFTTLVARHIGLVYSTAWRQTGNPQAAEEITQAVFIILARKAGSLGGRVVLSGWLYQTARLTAANHRRTEIRRAHREQEAYMNALTNENETSGDSELWQQIAPALESAMGNLSQSDRNAIVLRYFENKEMSEVAATLNASEAAARKRVNRAVERLRKFFGKRGMMLSAAALGSAVSANSIQAAPVGLMIKTTAVVAKGSAVAASTTILVKGTMKAMTWLKLKFAVGIGVVALLAGGVATMAISRTGGEADNLTAQDIAKESQNAYEALTSYSDTGKVVTEDGGSGTETKFSMRMQRPNLYRIEWTQTSGSYTSQGIVWGDGKENFLVSDSAKRFATATPQKAANMEMALAMVTGISHSAAGNIPGTFFNQNWGDNLRTIASGYAKVKRQPDEAVGEVDCYVVSHSLDPIALPHDMGTSGKVTIQLWIGKRDHLMHQIKTTSEGGSIHVKFTDEQIKTRLEREGKTVTPQAIAAAHNKLEQEIAKSQRGKYVFTQTHENISVNQSYSASDFTRLP